MSYRGYQATNTSGFSGGGVGGTVSGENDFAKHAQTVASNVQKISSNGLLIWFPFFFSSIDFHFGFFLVNHLQRMVNLLGTQQDSESFRSQL